MFRNVALAAGDLENLRDLIREDAFATHSRAEAGIVEFAAADGADAAEHFVFLLREVLIEPPLEQFLVRVGQAQHFIASVACAGLCHGFENRRESEWLSYRTPTNHKSRTNCAPLDLRNDAADNSGPSSGRPTLR